MIKRLEKRHAGGVYCSPPTPLLAAAHTRGTWVLRPPTPLRLRHRAHGCVGAAATPSAAAAAGCTWALQQRTPCGCSSARLGRVGAAAARPPTAGAAFLSLAHRRLPTVSSSCSTWLSALRQRGPGGLGEWRQLQAAAAGQPANTDALGRGRRSATPRCRSTSMRQLAGRGGETRQARRQIAPPCPRCPPLRACRFTQFLRGLGWAPAASEQLSSQRHPAAGVLRGQRGPPSLKRTTDTC